MIDEKGMKKRERIIVILVILGVFIFLLELYYVQSVKNKQNKYLDQQKEVATCDLDYIIHYKNLYMGNASNTINLFYDLPLSVAIKDYELLSDDLTVQVNFLDSKTNAGKESMKNKSYAVEGTADAINSLYQNEVNKSLIYNSVAAFALIDNLEGIIYNFTDITYNVKRDDIESIYGELNHLLDKDIWNATVRDPLEDNEYVIQLTKKLLIK